MACWYGSTAIPAGLLFFGSGFCMGCSARRIWLLLYPFSLKGVSQVLNFLSEAFSTSI
jgi:hypothetical protein